MLPVTDRCPLQVRDEATLPAGPRPAPTRAQIRHDLAARIRAIEARRPHPLAGVRAGRTAHLDGASEDGEPDIARTQAGLSASAWTLGGLDVQGALGELSLAPDALHEVKPAVAAGGYGTAAGWSAALAFALALAGRRQRASSTAAADAETQQASAHQNWGQQSGVQHSGARACGTILWCVPRRMADETGRLYGPGLATFGLSATDLVIVETGRQTDVLWAMEEGLRSNGLALVVGLLSDVALTPARRLALAAQASATPCLILTDARAPPAAATTTRWRIGRHRSHSHAVDDAAPGAPRYAVQLERWRGSQRSTAAWIEAVHLDLEWCHETLRFRLAPSLRDRAPAPDRSIRRSG